VEAFDEGQALFEVTELGVVSKRRDAPYRSGESRNWRRIKTAAWREANRERWRLFERRRDAKEQALLVWARRTPAKMISPSFMSGPRRRATTGTDESGDYSHMPAHCNARRKLAASTDDDRGLRSETLARGQGTRREGIPVADGYT